MSIVKHNDNNMNFFELMFNKAFSPFKDIFDPVNELSLLQMQNNMKFDEDNENYYIRASLPGFNDKDLKVEVKNNTIHISCQKTNKSTSKRDKMLSSTYESFSRSYTLPDDINIENIFAEMQNGILLITMPKMFEKTPKAKQIEIKAK